MNARWPSMLLLLIILCDPIQSAQIAVGGEKSGLESIQDAINAANAGDTIVVQAGIYRENVMVDKRLTLSGVNWPVIDSNGNGSSLELKDKGIIIEGFVLTNSSEYHPAINIAGSIFGSDFSNNIIRENNIKNNWQGIMIHSDNNEILKNIIINNKFNGIDLDNARHNILSENIIESNERGIVLLASGGNEIKDNSILRNKKGGIHFTSYLSEYGPYGFSDYNKILGNEINDNNDGINLAYSENNTIQDNRIINNINGLYLKHSINNSISGNIFINNSQNITSDNYSRERMGGDASFVTSIIMDIIYLFLLILNLVNILILIFLGLASGFVTRKLLSKRSPSLKSSLILGALGSLIGYFAFVYIISPSSGEVAYLAAIVFAIALVAIAGLMLRKNQ